MSATLPNELAGMRAGRGTNGQSHMADSKEAGAQIEQPRAGARGRWDSAAVFSEEARRGLAVLQCLEHRRLLVGICAEAMARAASGVTHEPVIVGWADVLAAASRYGEEAYRQVLGTLGEVQGSKSKVQSGEGSV